MLAVRLLSDPLNDHWLWDLRTRQLNADLTFDLGTRIPELHEWAEARGLRPQDGPGWIVSESWGGNTILRAPKGSRHNGSSIPPIAALVMGDEDDYESAGALHDVLYGLQAPREPSDRVWRIIAEAVGPKGEVSPVQGFLGYVALRLFGGVAYRRHGRAMAAEAEASEASQ